MMCFSLNPFLQPIAEADVLMRAPALKQSLHNIHLRQILHNDVAADGTFSFCWLTTLQVSSSFQIPEGTVFAHGVRTKLDY